MKTWLLAGLGIVCAAALVAVGVWLSHGGASTMSGAHAPAAASSTQRASGSALHADTGDSASKALRRSARASRAAPVWAVDKAASRLSFRGVMNGAGFDGVFRTWDAQIAFDPDNLPGSRATFTVDTASALTGEPIKDQALPNAEWLDSSVYPDATLVTRSIRQVGPGRYEATADVRIRGIGWRTTVPFTVQISRTEGRMDATLSVDRRVFGIGEGPFKSPAPVEPSVQVTMKLLAKKAS